MLKKYLVTLMILLHAAIIAAQAPYRLTGNVKNKLNQPIPGVIIYDNKTGKGYLTDSAGNFSFASFDSFADIRVTYLTFNSNFKIGQNKSNTLQIEAETRTDFKYSESIDVHSSFELSKVDAIKRGRKHSETMADKTRTGSLVYEKSYVYPSGKVMDADYYTPENYKALTAGAIDDFQKWKLWEDLSINEFNSLSNAWELFLNKRYTIAIQNSSHQPIPGVLVQLINKVTEEVEWEALSDNTGKAELWANINNIQDNSTYKIKCLYHHIEKELLHVQSFESGGIIPVVLSVDCVKNQGLDIAFVIDATGSMADEINFIKKELTEVSDKIKDTLYQNDIQFANVFYWDFGDPFTTINSEFTKNAKEATSKIVQMTAQGGGDYEEAVELGLHEAIFSLNWRKESQKIIFLILDAPPHQTDSVKKSMEKTIREAARKGIRIVPIACSGVNRSAEFLFRSIALATNGKYVFLTDKSGQGDSHLEPLTDEIKDQLFAQLITQIVFSFAYLQNCDDTLINKWSSHISDTSSFSITHKNNQPTLDTNQIEENKVYFTYYPNPTNGIIKFTCSQMPEEIWVRDLGGKLIKRISFTKESERLFNIGEFSDGIYFITAICDGKEAGTGKIIMIH